MRKMMLAMGMIPLVALAEPSMVEPPNCHSGEHMAYQKHMKMPGGPELFIFENLNLSEQQRTDINDIMKKSRIQMWERLDAERDLMWKLHEMDLSTDFKQVEADKLIAQISDLKIESLKQRTQIDRQVFELLTPEQQTALKNVGLPSPE